jgi:hypothetical protein
LATREDADPSIGSLGPSSTREFSFSHDL